ncbi:hypothetical protein NEFER03_1963 [Nematocida sp. LUAm3]|nr:hypothetical protein NEFER03_1963 [Nematocida sp. LUAm3]KAI5176047.1 hypothetical protein NEFER02_1881 [Nematocida sp. LUAm2]KAI5177091.1 hypothetical protein NEFER01_0366 [Nematocida sp. LUAm1]
MKHKRKYYRIIYVLVFFSFFLHTSIPPVGASSMGGGNRRVPDTDLEEAPKTVGSSLFLMGSGILGSISGFLAMFYGVAAMGSLSMAGGAAIFTIGMAILGFVMLIMMELPMMIKNFKVLWKNKTRTHQEKFRERNNQIYIRLINGMNIDQKESKIREFTSRTATTRGFVRVMVFMFSILTSITLLFSFLRIALISCFSLAILFPSSELLKNFVLTTAQAGATQVAPTAMGSSLSALYAISITPPLVILMSIALSCVELFRGYYKNRNLPKEMRAGANAYTNRMFLGSMLFRIIFYGLYAVTGFLPLIFIIDPLLMFIRMGALKWITKKIFPLKRTAKYYENELKNVNTGRQKKLQYLYIVLSSIVAVAVVALVVIKIVDPGLLDSFFKSLFGLSSKPVALLSSLSN